MARLIVHILLLTVLAVFIGFNVSYTTSVNLFGFRQVDGISVIVVILLSIVLGVLYSLFVYLTSAVLRARHGRMRQILSRQREQDRQERERQTGQPPGASAGAAAPGAPVSEHGPRPGTGGGNGPGGAAS